MRSIVWVLILIVPLALFGRVVLMALTGQKGGVSRSRRREELEQGTTPQDDDVTNAERGPF